MQYLILDGALRLRLADLFGRIFSELLRFKITKRSIVLLAEKMCRAGNDSTDG
ncbi:hypothetical protein [Burkholderia ubonensis]|uniref:hypothetical protein n=1 Tax=Burkholderia ubonensis TaxID=101571 RepID=UPI0012FDF484|nr:hypothetical protein [Burkholderia ubonensis]